MAGTKDTFHPFLFGPRTGLNPGSSTEGSGPPCREGLGPFFYTRVVRRSDVWCVPDAWEVFLWPGRAVRIEHEVEESTRTTMLPLQRTPGSSCCSKTTYSPRKRIPIVKTCQVKKKKKRKKKKKSKSP